jgi:hypothetical protein
MNVKTSNYYGTYMRVLQEMLKKTSGYYGDYMRVLQRMKNVNDYLCPTCEYYKECKMPEAIMGLICGYCKECKRPTPIMGLICGYCN